MSHLFVATLIALTTAADPDFVTRVENTPLLDSRGRSIPRVERDADGSVSRLQLNDMQLSVQDYEAIARVKTLRSLCLYRTETTDANIRQLTGLPNLQGMNLTHTNVTDATVDELAKFGSLRSVCLGNVAMTPEGVDRLKAHFGSQHKRLAVGYSQRK